MAAERPDGEHVDQGLVKHRKPSNISAFNHEVVRLFAIARGQSSWAAAE